MSPGDVLISGSTGVATLASISTVTYFLGQIRARRQHLEEPGHEYEPHGPLRDLLMGSVPVLLMKLLLLMYSQNDPRRAEYYADFKVMKWQHRFYFVGSMFSEALTEGLWPRYRSWRAKRRRTRIAASSMRLDPSGSSLVDLVNFELHRSGGDMPTFLAALRRALPHADVVDASSMGDRRIVIQVNDQASHEVWEIKLGIRSDAVERRTI